MSGYFTLAFNSFIHKHHVKLFFGCWIAMQLIQAGYTGLIDDEAYYWVYSNFLSWGYFDHPPLIAVLIKIGYSIFPNEFGVRLFSVLFSTLTLIILRKLLPQKNDDIFYLIVCSMAVLQIGGIMAVPDIPLIFFTSLFFLAYRNFLRSQKVLNILFLGLVMSLLLYSKYHGFLIILFTFLSNPRLALRYQVWLAIFICLLLFTPHLYWQYRHDFPSFRYHLFERVADNYSFSFTSEYLLGQILLAGPLVGWLLLWCAFRYRKSDRLLRALKFSLFGVYSFFLLSTLRGRVEANWTICAFIPLIILSHQYLLQHKKLINILRITVPVTLTLVMVGRVVMMLDIPPNPFLPKDEFHQNRDWADAIKKKAGDMPVVFINSYQQASKYWFYSGKIAFSMNTVRYRRNNYNFWPIEQSIAGKKALIVSPYNYKYYTDTFTTVYGSTGTTIINSFYSFSGIHLSAKNPLIVRNKRLISNSLIAKIDSTASVQLIKSGLQNQHVRIYVSKNDKKVAVYFTEILLKDLRQGYSAYELNVTNIFLPKGTYEAVFSLPSSLLFDPTLNSTVMPLTVE